MKTVQQGIEKQGIGRSKLTGNWGGLMQLGRTQFGWGRVTAALAVVCLGVSVAGAQGPGGDIGPGMGPHRPPMERAMGPWGGGPGGLHGDHGRWWNDTRLVEKYKLTETQRKAMDDIYQQHRLTLVDLHATLEKQELQMEPLIKADQPDEGKILSQIDRVAQARAELEKANARMLLGIRKELTPEQWKQLAADRAARREGHGGPDGPRHQLQHRGGPGTPPPDGQGGPVGGGPGADGPGADGPSEME
jgi:protein CpxP